MNQNCWKIGTLILFLSFSAEALAQPAYSPAVRRSFPNRVLWGDTHVHTQLSGDAVFKLGPESAFRFARGEEVTTSSGQRARLPRPLDFLVLADHGNNMGAEFSRERVKADPEFRDSEIGQLWLAAQEELLNTPGVDKERLIHGKLWPGNRRDVAIRHPGFRQHIWNQVTANADRFNDPGKFTAFIGYEWTSSRQAIHRVVVFKDGAERADQVLPFTAWDSSKPEDLWSFLAGYEEKTGGSILAIPHNSNLTSGLMFALLDSNAQPLTKEYAQTRSRWEPIVEATQIKGDSETHPYLSPNDEFADFETWNGWAGRENGGVIWTGRRSTNRPDGQIQFEYVRSALKLGLRQQAKTGANPFKFGLIGSSDSHTALSTVEEHNFWGKTFAAEPSADRIQQAYSVINWEMSAAGYAAVWANENTREAIFNAMRRREVYSTTGPRMTVRFFGGWDYHESDASRPNLAALGYAGGVPMGGDLTAAPDDKPPRFLIRAVKDPDGANLDRVQVIKGWHDAAGDLHERVYNVALSDGRRVASDGSVDPVGSTVNLADASYTNDIGDPELATVWTDPDFDPGELAFYYVRVIQIPTPRWTAYDVKHYRLQNVPDYVPMVTQDRAYTSPIWYTP